MMFTIGAFLLLLGFLFDEGTTFIMFIKGWEVLETNPIYLKFGVGGMIGMLVISYMVFLFTWKFLIVTNRKSIMKRHFHRKWYDLFVFMFCFLLITMVTTKIVVGYNHINMIVDYEKGGETTVAIDNAIEMYSEIRETEPVNFEEAMVQDYEDNTNTYSYWQTMFNALMAFLLFKIGYKTVPYDLA